MKVLAIILSTAIFGGCSGYLYGKNFSMSASERAKAILMEKLPELLPGEMALSPLGSDDLYESFLFIYKSEKVTGKNKNDIIWGEFYKLNNNANRLVLLMPGMGESVSTDGSARILVRNRFDAVRFLAKTEIFDLNLLDEKERFSKEEFRAFAQIGALALKTRYKDYLNIVAYFKRYCGYTKIGVSGVSLGGISAYYLSGKHPDIFQSTVGIVTGGGLADILMVSVEPRIKKIRDKIFQKFDISENEALSILREELRGIDPLSVAKNINPDSALLMSNVLDDVIPHKFTRKLWEAANKPRWKIMAMKLPVFWLVNSSFWLDGHYSSGLALFIPVPLFEFWGPFILPTVPSTADLLIAGHFKQTLK